MRARSVPVGLPWKYTHYTLLRKVFALIAEGLGGAASQPPWQVLRTC